MKSKINTLLILVILILFYVLIYSSKETERVKTISNKSLRESNPSFSAAVDAVNQGNLALGQSYLSEALSKEDDTRGQKIISLHKATAYLRLATTTEDKKRGVSQISALIDDKTTPKDIKAYAIQNLCQWYLAVGDTELYKTIFEDNHYSQYKGMQVDESINNLFLYSITFHPLSIPLLKTTLWDSEILIASSTVSTSTKTDFLKKAAYILSLVDKDTSIVEQSGNKIDTMSIFLARARLLADLEKIAGNQNLGNPVEYFNLAYERAKLNNVAVTKGHILLALGLYHRSNNNKASTHETLERLVNDESILSSNFKIYLVKLSKNTETSYERSLAVMLNAELNENSNVKEKLTRIGWLTK